MRVHETDRTATAKNREQGAKAHLLGGCVFAVGIILVVMSGSTDLAFVPVIGLVVGGVGRMVVDSNKIGS